MFIIPIRNQDLVVNRLPVVTIGIVALCILIFAVTSGRISDDAEQIPEAMNRVTANYWDHTYLELPDPFIADASEAFQKAYRIHREWLQEYQQAPEELTAWLERYSPPPDSNGRNAPKSDLGTMTDLMNSTSGDGGISPKKVHLLDDTAKYHLLQGYRKATAPQRAAQQDELASLATQFMQVKDSAIIQRWGYLPKHPKLLSVISYQFLHANVLHLLMNLLLLWLVAPQLEDRWGRRVFAVFYLGCGIIGILVHHVTHLGSNIPVIGASGAMAGVMGAFAFRYGRTKIHFFYMYFFLKLTPKTGTFEAPAHVMIAIWFLGQVAYAFLADFGEVAYWAHIGGFAAGLGTAVVFKFVDFEQKVLGLEPEKEYVPEDAALVAFSAPSKMESPARPQVAPQTAAQPYRSGPHPRELFLERLDRLLFHGRSVGKSVSFKFADVVAVAPGRMDRLGNEGTELFHMGLPKEPVFLIAILIRPATSDNRLLYVINAQQVRWKVVMETAKDSAAANIIQFTKLLLQHNPRIEYIHGPGPVGAHNMPIYDTLGGYLRHLQKRLGARSEAATNKNAQ